MFSSLFDIISLKVKELNIVMSVLQAPICLTGSPLCRSVRQNDMVSKSSIPENSKRVLLKKIKKDNMHSNTIHTFNMDIAFQCRMNIHNECQEKVKITFV